MRKKMYKKGKFWVVATIAASSVYAGTVVQADDHEGDMIASSSVDVNSNQELGSSSSITSSTDATVAEEKEAVSSVKVPVVSEEKTDTKDDTKTTTSIPVEATSVEETTQDIAVKFDTKEAVFRTSDNEKQVSLHFVQLQRVLHLQELHLLKLLHLWM